MKQYHLTMPEETFDAFCFYCEREYILPSDAIRRLAGLPVGEPTIFPPDKIEGKDQTTRFLNILYQLWLFDPDRFASAVEDYWGHKRRIFATTPEEVEETGQSNRAKQIYDSPYWVAVNSPGNEKGTHVSRIMKHLGFSHDYSHMISWSIRDGKGRLPFRFKRNSELSSTPTTPNV